MRNAVQQLPTPTDIEHLSKARVQFGPGLLLMAPVLVSVGCWLIPGESLRLRGFGERADVSFLGIVFILCWYLMSLGVLRLGFNVGRHVKPAPFLYHQSLSRRFSRRMYNILTVASVIGVSYSVYLVQLRIGVVDVLVTNRGNELTESLGGVAGIATLRYTSAVAAPLGIFLWRRQAAPLLLCMLNCVLLAVNALFTSRLSIVMAIVVYLVVRSNERPLKFRLGLLTCLAVAAFSIFGALNWFRNAHYYEQEGVADPALMNCYQILTYLDAPAQVSLGVAGPILDGSLPGQGGAGSALGVVTPTFFQEKMEADTHSGLERYGFKADVDNALTTNSAFADTFSRYGWWGLLYVLLSLGIVGFLYGHLLLYGPVIAAAGGVLAYGLAEFWRIYLFSQGILVYLVCAITVGAVVLALVDNAKEEPSRASV